MRFATLLPLALLGTQSVAAKTLKINGVQTNVQIISDDSVPATTGSKAPSGSTSSSTTSTGGSTGSTSSGTSNVGKVVTDSGVVLPGRVMLEAGEAIADVQLDLTQNIVPGSKDLVEDNIARIGESQAERVARRLRVGYFCLLLLFLFVYFVCREALEC